jgi:hypothetical protein
MNKRTYILIAISLLLGAVYFLFVNKPWSNFRSERKDFAIKDTASITKIFLADKRNHQVLLEQNEEGVWMVDGNHRADIGKINLLKATMHDVEVRNPLADSEYNSTIAILATNGIKVEFYSKDALIKTIYVGTSTPDNTGTFMMMENATTPYVTHIPGFVGYLTPRFNVFPIKWKSKELFTYDLNDIASVEVHYPRMPEKGFKIDNRTNEPVVSSKTDNSIIASELNFVRYYLGSFSNLYFEGYDEDVDSLVADSIHKSEPYCIIQLVTKKGLTKRMQVHFKAIDKRTKDRIDIETGKELAFDPEKYIAFVDDEKDLVYIQHYNFGKLFKHAEDFSSRGSTP